MAMRTHVSFYLKNTDVYAPKWSCTSPLISRQFPLVEKPTCHDLKMHPNPNTVTIQCFCYSSPINVHCTIQQQEIRKQLGGNSARVSSSCTEEVIVCLQLLTVGSLLRSRCLLPINQPLTLDASQLFEHDSNPMYIAWLKSKSEEKDLQLPSLVRSRV